MGFWQNIFYNKSIHRLRQMLEAVRMRDFSLQYKLDNLTGEERLMAAEINSVIREFRETEHRHESESHLYEALLSKVDSILIATDNNGHVKWMNSAAIERLCGFRFEAIEHLAALHSSLPEQLKQLNKKNSRLISFTMPNGEERQYAASLTNIFISGIPYRLYNLQSVAAILIQSEITAQQRLLRVLTHEIMNSLAPIASLSDTLIENIGHKEKSGVTDEEMHIALSTINRRANGLMQFVQRYRRISGIATPVLQTINLSSFIQGIKELFPLTGNEPYRMIFDIKCSDRLLNIDRSQMEQVFINLIKNATETKAAVIKVTATVSDDKRWFIIAVEDDGGGLSDEVYENLFTPFFSTKQNGEGIGLAVCRHIVANHGGLIAAECVNDGKGARFTVRLPQK